MTDREPPHPLPSQFAELLSLLGETRGLRALDSEAGQQQCLDFELVSSAEIRLGQQIDIGTLDDRSRLALAQRVQLAPGGTALDPSGWFWITDEEQRVGSVCCWPLGNDVRRIGLGSLYVLPMHRHRGHARRALLAVKEAAQSLGAREILLETSWCSPAAARLYLQLGMWVRGWKRDLSLSFEADLPPWSAEFDGDCAQFVVGEERVPLIIAERRGDRLSWTEPPSAKLDADSSTRWLAQGTFALVLALQGFPLIRCDKLWREQLDRGFSDIGGPEGLAFKIRLFEAWAREHGWVMSSPRIPGLDYPSWGELNSE